MQYLKKRMGNEVDFLRADKHQIDSNPLGVRSKTCPKYPRQQVCISLQYLKKNVKDEVDFLLADKHQRFLQIDTIILGLCVQACPNYPK